MPITGIYGPDDFANRPQGQVPAPPRAHSAANRPRAAEALTGMDCRRRAGHCAAL
ncbi:hypothetical protein ACVI8K_002062 [Bradyrhizobium barranii subsp. barranii]